MSGIGALNKRVTLQSPTAVADGMGGQTRTWETERVVFAAIWPVSAKERLAGGQQTHEGTTRIRIRYWDAVRPDWRVQYGDRYFAILGIVNPSEKGQWLDLLCGEVAA